MNIVANIFRCIVLHRLTHYVNEGKNTVKRTNHKGTFTEGDYFVNIIETKTQEGQNEQTTPVVQASDHSMWNMPPNGPFYGVSNQGT